MNSCEMPKTDCSDPAHISIFMTRERKALPLNPLPIWVIIRSAQKCVCDLSSVAAAKKSFDL